nr:glycosyltransferase [Cytobacillus horneckiae]
MESDAAYRIYTIHTNHFDAPHIYGSPIKEDHVTLLNNIEKEDALVVLTESQKKDIVKQFGDYKNVHVVPNFITPIKNVTFNRNPNLVTMISRYHPEKGIDEAIHAFKKVIQKLPQAKFEIYGHGEDEERLKKLINQLGLSNQVFLKGYTTNVGDVFGKSSLTLLTSKFEGLNVVCLESMSCKVPVVSYDVNYGMSDMIRDGETGYLVKHGDQAALADNIIDLLNHPKKIKEMGQRAYDFVLTNYSKGQVCQKWITLFNELEKAELS